MSTPNLHSEAERLMGLEDVSLGVSAPPPLRVINLRRQGIDQFTINIASDETSTERGWFQKILPFRAGGQQQVVKSVTIFETQLKFTYAHANGANAQHKSIDSKDVDAIVIRPANGRKPASVVIFHGVMQSASSRGRIDIGSGLPQPALIWLRDRLLLEVAGLVSKPLYNVGRRSTRETVNPDEDLYSTWPRGPNRLIECYLESAPQQLRDLADAIETSAWADASMHVHWLKSSSAAVAARYLSSLFQRMELSLAEKDHDRTRALMTHVGGEFTKVCTSLANIIHGENSPSGDDREPRPNTLAFRPEADQSFPEKRILLAEDSRVNQELALDLLQQLGCVVDCVESGEEAVRRAAAESFDLILMDCQMPGMGGLEATRAIRQMERERGTRGATIVALTAHTLQDDRNNCLAAGMDDHLGKPFMPDDFVNVVSRWLCPADQPGDREHEAAGAEDQAEEQKPQALEFFPVDHNKSRLRKTKKTWSSVDKRIWSRFKS